MGTTPNSDGTANSVTKALLVVIAAGVVWWIVWTQGGALGIW